MNFYDKDIMKNGYIIDITIYEVFLGFYKL